MKNTLTLAYSPCPNDTFIFDAMVHGKIDTEGLAFDVYLGDVEDLNQRAFRVEMDITKLSYHAFTHCTPNYILLRAGSALGNNCGPLLIAGKAMSLEAVNEASIAIPGKYTTASFLLNFAFPKAQNRIETLFSEIEEKIKSGTVDLGVIIHENRFTYQERGFYKIMDLGEYWEQETKLPIPLGGIVVKRSMDIDLQQKINRVLRHSVEYAFAHPEASLDYVSEHAQEMDASVVQQHIQLYVNQFTVDLGEKGEAAVQKLFDSVGKEFEILDAY